MPLNQLTQWEEHLQKNLPVLTVSQARVLALFSFAVATCGSCGLTSVASALALMLRVPWQRLRQRLREFYKPAKTKRGKHRREIDVSCCFAGLLAWILRLSEGTRLALAIDATTLSDRFTILSISVLYRATAIPVAWCVLAGNTKGAWKPHWIRMFQLLRSSVPPEVLVIVCADRGLYAHWMFTAICDCGWHPMLRVNDQGHFRHNDGTFYKRFSDVLDASKHEVQLPGVAFDEHPLACTLLAYQSPEHKDPWLVVTDLPPDQTHVQWYGLRSWIEQSFKAIKRGSFQWQRTRMSDPERVERLWLVLAVATLLVVLLATRQEDHDAAESVAAPVDTQAPCCEAPSTSRSACRPRTSNGSSRRHLRLQRLGQFVLLALLSHQHALGRLYLTPEPWVDRPPSSQPSVVNELKIKIPPS